MSTPALVTFDHVRCSFKVRQGLFRFRTYDALRDISLSINQGDTLGVIGNNGAGKSTLLKLIAGILVPDSGLIQYFQPASVALLSLQMGFNPQLSGRINAIINAMLIGFTREEAEARLDRIIEFAELREWIDSPLKTYSSGMQARLGFGVALEMSPDILLIDEVLGVGDQSFQQKSSRAMQEKMQSEQTIVFVSHDLATVKSLCNRCLWIEDGQTMAEGGTDEVIAAYLAFGNHQEA
ncbi:ABC transporter ATP-binding protein [Pseudodesulfovibrio karagichevae]|uniref:ABC transporter ATP-binding protein n=1 Tax=Pseudodesulfovibrio karagichevae TaxID=3239305 RepID=A0ABV4K2U2_9BACT